MTKLADVAHIDTNRLNWRPVRESCWWCGSWCIGVVSEHVTATTPLECYSCGLMAATVAKEPPEGWQDMSDDELHDAWNA